MRWRSSLFAGLCAAVVGWGGEALAYRPFDSTDADVAKPLELELEIGPIDYLVVGGNSWLAPNLVVNLGVLPRLELVVQIQPFIYLGPSGGPPKGTIQGNEFDAKVVVRNGSLQDGTGPSIAVEGGVLLPAFSGPAAFGALVTLIFSQRIPAGTLSLDGTVQLTQAGNAEFDGGLILEGPDAWSVRPVAELLVGHENHVGTTYSALVGAIWRLNESVSLDIAVRAGRALNEPLAEVRAGLTWAIPL